MYQFFDVKLAIYFENYIDINTLLSLTHPQS